MDPAHYSHPGAILAKDENYQGVLIFQVSLHDKNIFGTISKCVDCAGVQVPDLQVSRYIKIIQLTFRTK